MSIELRERVKAMETGLKTVEVHLAEQKEILNALSAQLQKLSTPAPAVIRSNRKTIEAVEI